MFGFGKGINLYPLLRSEGERKGFRKGGESALFGAASGGALTRPSVSDLGRESITQLSQKVALAFSALAFWSRPH
jgi:hypothetical protein